MQNHTQTHYCIWPSLETIKAYPPPAGHCMDRLIETLREEQLVKVILLLDDGKRHEAVQYLSTDSHVTEAEAQQLIDELIRQPGLAMEASKGGSAAEAIGDISTAYFDTAEPPRPQRHSGAQAAVEPAANGIED